MSIFDSNSFLPVSYTHLDVYKRQEFESNIDIDKTIQICRELCREETPLDEDEIRDLANRYPEANPFEQLYNNPNSEINSDLRLATLNKLGAIAKKRKICKLAQALVRIFVQL